MDKDNMYFGTENTDCENSVKNVTSRILHRDGNLLKLILCGIICIVTTVMPYILATACAFACCFGEFVDEEQTLTVPGVLLFMAFFIGGYIFFTLPTIGSYILFAKKTVQGEGPQFVEFISVFKSKGLYLRSIGLVIFVLVRILCLFLPLVGAVGLVTVVFDIMFDMALIVKLCAAFIIITASFPAFCVMAYICSFFYFVPALILDGKRFFCSIAESVKMSNGKRAEITKETVYSFVGGALSVLSFGVLLILYYAPKMSVSYFVHTNKMFNEKEN